MFFVYFFTKELASAHFQVFPLVSWCLTVCTSLTVPTTRSLSPYLSLSLPPSDITLLLWCYPSRTPLYFFAILIISLLASLIPSLPSSSPLIFLPPFLLPFLPPYSQHTIPNYGGSTWGVNGTTGESADMTKLAIWEPYCVKTQTLKTAIERYGTESCDGMCW